MQKLTLLNREVVQSLEDRQARRRVAISGAFILRLRYATLRASGLVPVRAEPFDQLTCACGTGAGRTGFDKLRINSTKGLSERFFALLRMTIVKGRL